MANSNPNPRFYRSSTFALDLGGIDAIVLEAFGAPVASAVIRARIVLKSQLKLVLELTKEEYDGLLDALQIYLSNA